MTVPESVPGGPASSSALSDGGPKGAKGKGSQVSDSVPATLPPRKNYDEDSNQSGALRHVVYRIIIPIPHTHVLAIFINKRTSKVDCTYQ